MIMQPNYKIVTNKKKYSLHFKFYNSLYSYIFNKKNELKSRI